MQELGPHTTTLIIQCLGSSWFRRDQEVKSLPPSWALRDHARQGAALFQFNLDPGVELLFLFKVKYKLAAVSEQCLGPSWVPSVASWCCCCVMWVASITCHVSACVAHRSPLSPRHLSQSTHNACPSQSDAEKHNHRPIRGLRNHKLLETFILSIMGEPGEARNPCHDHKIAGT